MVSKRPAKSKGLARTVVYLPPEDRDEIARLALEERVSESEIYRRAVAEYLERPRSKPSRKP